MLHKNQTRKNFRTWQGVDCLIGLLLIIGIGGGCGKDDQSAPKGSAAFEPLQACELLTKPEIEAIFGGSVEEPRQTFEENQKQRFWMSTCTYYAPATSQSANVLIRNSQNADPVKAFEAHTASLTKTLGDQYHLQVIEGIGTRAAWDGSVKQLTVFAGPRMLIVSTGRPGEEEKAALEVAKTIALKVLSKLTP